MITIKWIRIKSIKIIKKWWKLKIKWIRIELIETITNKNDRN